MNREYGDKRSYRADLEPLLRCFAQTAKADRNLIARAASQCAGMTSRSHRRIAFVMSSAIAWSGLALLAGCGGGQPAGEIISTLADDGIRTAPQARNALRTTIQSETRLPPIAPQADAAVPPIMERAEAVVTLRQFMSDYGSDVVCASVELLQSASDPGPLS